MTPKLAQLLRQDGSYVSGLLRYELAEDAEYPFDDRVERPGRDSVRLSDGQEEFSSSPSRPTPRTARVLADQEAHIEGQVGQQMPPLTAGKATEQGRNHGPHGRPGPFVVATTCLPCRSDEPLHRDRGHGDRPAR
jgi:hypothetical protein